METFQSRSAVWWSVGLVLVLLGFFLTAVLLPHMAEPYGNDAPDLRLPAMKNVPSQQSAPDLRLESGEE